MTDGARTSGAGRTSRPDTPRGDRRAAVDTDPAGGNGVPLAAIAVGGAVVLAATLGMVGRVEPFATWYYVFAWYGTLLALDGMVAWTRGVRARVGERPSSPAGTGATPASRATARGRSDADADSDTGDGSARRGRFLLLARPGFTLTLLAWSAVTWLFFEVLNLRLRNWYYIFLPNEPAVRWGAVLVSFATVLPAVLTSEALLHGLGVARDTRSPRVRWTPQRLRALRLAGTVMFLLPLIRPEWFFPLVWGGVLLLLEPSNYRRDPSRSLLGDLERGRPGRILRLLLGGAMIGLLWELFNIEARGKWIYTVPGLEELKLFEMPLLGFLGFPPFALECFAIWQALVLGGLAVPRIGPARPAAHGRRVGAALAAVAFAAATLLGMERRTISSYTPTLAELPGVPAAALASAGFDVFSLAAASPEALARVTAEPAEHAHRWVETARLAALRGIGTANARALMAAGIETVDQLADVDPGSLTARLRTITGVDVVEARVRVWVRAARDATRRPDPSA